MVNFRNALVVVLCLAVTGCLARFGGPRGPEMREHDGDRHHEKGQEKGRDRDHGDDRERQDHGDKGH